LGSRGGGADLFYEGRLTVGGRKEACLLALVRLQCANCVPNHHIPAVKPNPKAAICVWGS